MKAVGTMVLAVVLAGTALTGCAESTESGSFDAPSDSSFDVTASNQRAVSRADYGASWPLTVGSGTLRCEGAGQVGKVTFTTGGTTYWVNGLASAVADERGWLDIESIWADDPAFADDPALEGLKISIGPLIFDGLALCGGEGSDQSGRHRAVKPTPKPKPAQQSKPKLAQPQPREQPYVIRLKATAEGAGLIRVVGRTNLPDEARIEVSASRAFRYTHEADARVVRAAYETATVSGGTFDVTLATDEGDMVVTLETDVDDPAWGPIAAVDRAVTVCAMFQTGDDLDGKPRQPSEQVRATVGDRGQQLKGSPQLTVFGSATPKPANWLEKTVRVPMRSPLLEQIAVVQGRPAKVRRLAGFCYS